MPQRAVGAIFFCDCVWRAGAGGRGRLLKMKRPAGFAGGPCSFVETRAYDALRTLEACRPFGPLVTSNSTLSPSERLLKP